MYLYRIQHTTRLSVARVRCDRKRHRVQSQVQGQPPEKEESGVVGGTHGWWGSQNTNTSTHNTTQSPMWGEGATTTTHPPPSGVTVIIVTHHCRPQNTLYTSKHLPTHTTFCNTNTQNAMTHDHIMRRIQQHTGAYNLILHNPTHLHNIQYKPTPSTESPLPHTTQTKKQKRTKSLS